MRERRAAPPAFYGAAGGPARTQRRPAPAPAIQVAGARTHNLKGVSCRFPIGALTVVTGPSGSGKSSLAFDTLYAEGQRRFVESMSTYARQFLERLPRPDVDRIDHVLPAVAIEQKAPSRSARSTVGTATEVHDVLRLVFSSIGVTSCGACGGRVSRRTAADVAAAAVDAAGPDGRVVIAAALPPEDRQALLSRLSALRRAGLFRLVDASGATGEVPPDAEPPRGPDGRTWVVVGRHVVGADGGDRELSASVETALSLGEGELLAFPPGEAARARRIARGLVCEACSLAGEERTPAHFSFNSPRGACPACQGFGRIPGIDEGRVVPDPSKCLSERPIAPFNTPAYASAYDDLFRACRRHGVRRDVPWSTLTDEERSVVWDGRGSWYGVKGLFEWLEGKRYKVHVRVLIARYRGYETCAACRGARLAPGALAVRALGRTLPELCDVPLTELLAFLERAEPTRTEAARAGSLLEDARCRVATLVGVGLGYLSLSRPMRTLSGGEAQRVQLGAAIGASLTGTLYVLDEPTVGLHPSDTRRLLDALLELAARGNALAVVEHDLDVVRAASHVVDLGPRAGRRGGRLVFEGPPSALASLDTATGRALRADRDGALLLAAEGPPRPGAGGELRVVGARANNLAGITVRFPLGGLVAVCGVSGSGKSSLAVDVLARGAARLLGGAGRAAPDDVGAHDRIEGLSALDDVVLVDQSPLGRSGRSNPATVTKAWDDVRTVLARTPAARARGLTKGSFSFNAPGGRCERCEGSGTVSVDMQFLADVTVVCDACDGRRFAPAVLEVRWRGRNVDEWLETTVEEAIELFADVPAVWRKLAPLADAGLGYLGLGQSTVTLSGGEAQRLKVASFLGRAGRGQRVLFVLDEPTTGLHPEDVETLLVVLRRLVAAGHSVLAVEHNVPFLRRADHLVELGPGGGAGGGRVVFEGSPAEMLARGQTATAAALRGPSAG